MSSTVSETTLINLNVFSRDTEMFVMADPFCRNFIFLRSAKLFSDFVYLQIAVQ